MAAGRRIIRISWITHSAASNPPASPQRSGRRACRSGQASVTGLRGVKGSIAALVVALGILGLSPMSAWAAPPEAPEVFAPCSECVTATEAPAEGILNPGKEGEGGTFELDTYEFVYRPASAECKGAGDLTTEPTLSLGAGKELVSQRLTGLASGTSYALCLVVHNPAKETSASSSVAFKTAFLPETPETLPPTDVTATSAVFHATLDPNQTAEGMRYKFFYEPSSTECTGAHSIAIPETAIPASGVQSEAVQQMVADLLPTTTYTYCAFVRNEASEEALGAPVTFTTPAGIPAISNETTPSIGTNSAEVSALVAPGGLTTAYHVEYVAQAQFNLTGWDNATRVPAKDASLPAALTAISVREQLVGLSPGTEYLFRFLASNGVGGASVDEHSFTTRSPTATNSTALPDARQYELVSGSTSGNTYVPAGRDSTVSPADALSLFPMQSSDDGNSITYVGDPFEQNGNGLTGAQLGNQYLARRDSAAHGWSASVITPQAAGHEEAEIGTEYQGFATDLSRGVIGVATDHFAALTEPPGPTACNALYTSNFTERYHPLFTETQTPGFCGILPVGGEPSPTQSLLFAGGNKGTSGTPAYADLLFQTPAALTAEAEPSVEGEGDNLYLSASSKPYLISVLPNGQSDHNAVFGSPPVELTERFDSANHHFGASNVISADGSRIFWTDLSTHRVYLRENPTAPESARGTAGECLVPSGACTIAVSNASATYWTATPDGHYVLYTEGGELWRFNTISLAHEALLQTDEEGRSAGVRGVVGASDDGAYIYVVAEGKMASTSEERRCTEPTEETGTTPEEVTTLEAEQKAEREGVLPPGRGCNLYLLHIGVGVTFIKALAAKDNALDLNVGAKDIRLGAWQPDMGVRTAEVTPNGLGLVFESTQRLLGYDTSSLVNRANPPEPEQGLEIFVYNANRDGSGTLSCASCEPRGQAAPAGGTTYMAVSFNSTYTHRWISDDGHRVFFNTNAPLVPQDTNGTLDVYEWEAGGSGCPTATSSYGGCLFLLSGGGSASRSFFIDASASGDDVFFTHRGRLGQVGSLTGNSSLFDARVDGGFQGVAVGCDARDCGTNAPSLSAVTGLPTEVSGGGGNVVAKPPSRPKSPTAAQLRTRQLKRALQACRSKHNKRKRKRCERGARRRIGAGAAQGPRSTKHARRTK